MTMSQSVQQKVLFNSNDSPNNVIIINNNTTIYIYKGANADTGFLSPPTQGAGQFSLSPSPTRKQLHK